LASIETFAASLLDQVGASRAVNVVPDDSVAPGGCKVESGRTGIDATLEAQVDEMTSLLLGGGGNDG
jgi:flagellar biosynthesis/type III secretory pathway protein FliH